MVELLQCGWCDGDDLYRQYHDHEWGVPCRDDTKLFEFLILEGAQAGLSWLTILKRREHYRRAFADFQVDKIAAFDSFDVARLMLDKGIVRNRLKLKVLSLMHATIRLFSPNMAVLVIIFGDLLVMRRLLIIGLVKIVSQ